MYLTRFAVKNYKCLADIDIPLTPIHVIIGENDTGKTSLIEAIERFYWSGDSEKFSRFFVQDTTKDLYHGHDDEGITFAGNWDVFSEESWKSIDFPYQLLKKNKSVDGNGTFKDINNGRITEKKIKLDSLLKPDMYRKMQLENTSSENFYSKVSSCLESVQRYAFQPRVLSLPSALAKKDQQYTLQPDGFGLPSLLDFITDYDPGLFIKIREQFCRLFPQYRNIRQEKTQQAMSRIPDNRPDLQDDQIFKYPQTPGKTFYFETTDGKRLDPPQVSDGVLMILAYLAISYAPNRPRLILLEEPENGIYPKRLAQVIGLLKSLAGQPMNDMDEEISDLGGEVFPQIIMTTHSPYVLSFFKPEEATYLSRDPSTDGRSARAQPFRDAPHIHERLGNGEFYLGELWYNLDEKDLFGN